MDPRTRATYTDAILAGALHRFGIERASLAPLDGFESRIFACRHAGRARILRIADGLRRPVAWVEAEVAWIAHLAGHGLGVCPAVPSRRGRRVEPLGTGDDPFVATLSERAPGAPAGPGTWEPPLFDAMGRMMGRMHALARRAAPARVARPDWDRDLALPIEGEAAPVVERLEALVDATRALPRGVDDYGLVHCDFHRGNFFVHEGAIHLFDFDDCQYSWFADDVAIALFYAVPHRCDSRADRDAAGRFLRHFLAGYRAEGDLDARWLARIPLFLARREVELYNAIRASDAPGGSDRWARSYMTQRAERIAAGTPYVDLDFASF